MSEQKWLKLRDYLETNHISYETEYVYISGTSYMFAITLPFVTVYTETD